MENSLEKSDYWWLNPNQRSKYQQIGVGHHRPIRDDEDPRSIEWDNAICSISELRNWREKFNNINVYRTLKVTVDRSESDEVIGPFLIDIDNSDEKIEDSLAVAKRTLIILRDIFKLDSINFKIFFTGRKGFNFEIIPQALGIKGTLRDQIKSSAHILQQVTEKLREGKSWTTRNVVSDAGTVIDQIYGNRLGYELKHPFVRLRDPLNTWTLPNSKIKSRMKIEMTTRQLTEASAGEIIERSEKQIT